MKKCKYLYLYIINFINHFNLYAIEMHIPAAFLYIYLTRTLLAHACTNAGHKNNKQQKIGHITLLFQYCARRSIFHQFCSPPPFKK